MYQICQRVNIWWEINEDFFFIAFHFEVQAIPIVLFIDNKASKLKQAPQLVLLFQSL